MKSSQTSTVSSSPTSPSSRPTNPLLIPFLLVTLLALAVLTAIFVLAHRPTLAYPLPPHLAARALPLINQLRVAVFHLAPVPCTPTWHRARHLMATSFASVRAAVPGTRISHIWTEPLVTFFDDYLTDAEIDLLLRLAEPKFAKSQILLSNGSVGEDKSSRTSDTAWIYPTVDQEADALVEKLSNLAGFPPHNAEAISVNRYRKAQYFAPHHDYLGEDHLTLTTGDFNRCQRTATVLVYLSDVASGGETMFVRNGTMDRSFQFEAENPDHIAVKPRRGRVLVWFDMHPHTERIDTRTMHGGAPVKEGVKVAATLFLRNCTSDLFKPKKKPQPEGEGRKEEL